MRKLRRSLIRFLGEPSCALAVIVLRLTRRRLGFAVLYHSIVDVPRDPELEITPSHPSSLYARQIRHLRRWYRIVDSTELLAAVAARRRGERFPVAITFDDDLPEHVRIALPVLERLGVRATFFLCGASLDRPFAFWWERLERAVDMDAERTFALVGARLQGPVPPGSTVRDVAQSVEHLTPPERTEVARQLGHLVGPDPEDAGMRADGVRALVNARMTIGFHTLRHDPLDSLDDTALDAALRDGREQLDALAGSPLEVIAYPHGRTNTRVARASARAGFTSGLSSDGLPVRPDDDPLLVPRITPSHRSTGHFALQLLLCLLSAETPR